MRSLTLGWPLQILSSLDVCAIPEPRKHFILLESSDQLKMHNLWLDRHVLVQHQTLVALVVPDYP
jgi:hypothetical protein